jgi:hypothetical protein
MESLRVLVLGAAYGLLPAVRISLAGHRVSVMCRAEERDDLARHGATVTFMRRDGRAGQVLAVPAGQGMSVTPGQLGLVGADADPSGFDMVFSALGEPQLAAPEIAALFSRIAAAGKPLVALANLLPLPFLARLGRLNLAGLRSAYQGAAVWDMMDPDLVTAASPDAQAVRTDPTRAADLTVTLGSNFKIAPFASTGPQAVLERLAADVGAFRCNGVPLPARLIAHTSLHVPLAKWPMLITGNCRSVTDIGPPRPIAEAVSADIGESFVLYAEVTGVARRLGAAVDDLVPFSTYASAARSLSRPSSLARALAQGAIQVERIDLMIAHAAAQVGVTSTALDRVVERIERKLASNRAAFAAV